MKVVVKAQKIATLPIKAWDYTTEDCYSLIEIYWGCNGHVYYSYIHSDWQYCSLYNFPLENCPHWNEYRTCSNCPNTLDFVIINENDSPLPVNRLT